MFRKSTILLIVISMILCVFSACTVEQEDSGATALPVATSTAVIEDGNDLDITDAGFDLNKIKTGDTVSVFKVSSVNIDKAADGTITSGLIKFTGPLSVRGSYTLKDDKAEYSPLAEYVNYLPYPSGAGDYPEMIAVSADDTERIYGDAESGYAAIVIEEYSLKYDSETGKWQVSVDSFDKDENEYVVIP